MPGMRAVVCFERACHEGVYSHAFDRVRVLKPP